MTTAPMKGMRRNWKPGTLFRINLPEGVCAYAQLLSFPYIRVFDARAWMDNEPGLADVLAMPVMFAVMAHKSIVTGKNWNAIGTRPLDGSEKAVTAMRSLDDPRMASVFPSDGTPFGVPIEQAKHIEPAASWEAHHLEDRAVDFYAGRESEWLRMSRRRQGFLE